jgi:hypothetical protein
MATLHSFTSANPFYKGASMRELATLFEVPLTTVKDRIVGWLPVPSGTARMSIRSRTRQVDWFPS